MVFKHKVGTVHNLGMKLNNILLSFVILLTPFAAVFTNLSSATAANLGVTPSNTQGWSPDNIANATTDYISDSSAPLGSGSLEVKTPGSSDKAQFFRAATPGTLLSDVNDLGYWTYRSADSTGNPAQVTSVNLGVDINGAAADGFTSLVFEPVYQVTAQGALVDNAWQSWNAGNESIWWSSNAIPGAPNRDTFVTLASIKASNPDAIVMYYGFNQGSGNSGIISRVDGLTYQGTTFDFEQDPVSAPAQPTGLRLNDTEPCGYATNINSITPTWNAVADAVSYNYKVTTPNGSLYGPTNVGNVTSVTGAFGGEGLSTFSVQAVAANGLTSEWANDCSVTYDVDSPDVNLVSPSNNAITNGNSLTQTWASASTDIDHYIYESYNNQEATSLRWRENFTSTSKTATNVAESTFWWRVTAVDKAGNSSSTPLWKLTIDNTVPATPKNLSMKVTSSGQNIPNNSVTNKSDVTASWEKGDSEDVTYIYKVWYDNGSPYNAASPWENPISATSYAGVFNQGDGDVHFCVVAVDSAGNESACSTPFNVTYDGTAPSWNTAQVHVSPADDATVTTSSQTLVDWTDATDGSGGQIKYYYQVSYTPDTNPDGSFANPIWTFGPLTASEMNTTGTAPSTYYWHVQAEDQTGNKTPWTSPWKGTVVADDIPDSILNPGDSSSTGSGDNSSPAPSFARTAASIIATTLTGPAPFSITTAVFNDDGTVSAQITPEATAGTEPGSVLGAEDSLAKNAAQADSNTKGLGLFGIAWYWIVAALAALLAGWWFIAGYRRRKDNKQA